MPKISCCIITLDQADRLKMAIGSIRNLVDEIIVVDGGSRDQTLDLAKDLGAVVYSKKWASDFGAQRNYSLEKASNDWVLVLDSDEVFEFGKTDHNFQKIINKHQEADGFFFTRSNFLDNQKTGSVGDFDRQLRLFRKSIGSYTEKIHESARGLKQVVEIPREECLILHYKSRSEQQEHLKYQRTLMVKFIKDLESRKILSEDEKKSLVYEREMLHRWDIWWHDTK